MEAVCRNSEGKAMRAVVTRVNHASVTIDGEVVGKIEKGFLVLLGVHKDDTTEIASWMADRIMGLRIFEDEDGKMNLNPMAAGYNNLLIVSQFTLYGDVSSRRPGFSDAARPELAIPLYEQVIAECKDKGFHVETGRFGAEMMVNSENDGPVTILIEK